MHLKLFIFKWRTVSKTYQVQQPLQNAFQDTIILQCFFPANSYLLKVNNRFTRKSCEIFSKLTLKTRVQIKSIAITMAKCNLSFQYRDAKETSFNYFRDTKLCPKHKKSHVNSVYWDHLCKVNKWCLVDYFHREFMVSIQIMSRDYCIAKCKKFSACGGLRAIFFGIQNIYVDSNLENTKWHQTSFWCFNC